MARIARTLGYEGNTNWNSFNYLGVPIHKGKKNYSDWKGLVEKTKKQNPLLGRKMAQSCWITHSHQRLYGILPYLILLDLPISKDDNPRHHKGA